MASISWSEMMSVGVPEIDADHKTLLGLLNHLHHAVGDPEEFAALGSVLLALEDYVEHHFTREERMMVAARYPNIEGHKAAHSLLTGRVRDLRERYDGHGAHCAKDGHGAVHAKECLDFLGKWLVDHICTADMDYRGWVVGHSGAASAGVMPMAGSGKDIDWAGLKLLVVDDNDNFCQIMTTILGGIRVGEIRLAKNVPDAKSILDTTPVDMVITDWHVGHDSGLDLVHWIRNRPDLFPLPVLMLSGHERIANRDVALAAGADEFMEKPISARGLLMCLSRLLARRECRQ